MKINNSTFVIVSNGFADGPAQALRDYLLQKNAKKVTTIFHPLVPEGGNAHIITTYENGKKTEKKIHAPLKPPFTYPLDMLIPWRLEKSTAWFCFNNLAVARGIWQKKLGNTEKVFYWAVDFAPDRFGKGVVTRVYNYFDRKACKETDGRVELTQMALEKRPVYLGINKETLAPSVVVPMGAWLKRTPKVKEKTWLKKSAVYMGHLVERQGVDTFINAVSILKKRGIKIQAEIIGNGPMKETLESQAKKLKISDITLFHGFVKSHEDVEKILSQNAIAVAPYKKDPTSFTQFADAGKLKAYMGASLPIVMTDVPPNTQELQSAGLVRVAEDNPEAFADALQAFLQDEKSWSSAKKASAKKAQEFDWDFILSTQLAKLGFK